MALPPEVHSALLSSGPGTGSLLAAAAAWQSLSTEYATAAAELTNVLASVQAGAWEGPSSEQYVAAHTPYLAWLSQQSAHSAASAAQHETAAAAYSTALATMPTLPELAANHATHAVLVATNFLGINTIPIALNEADYVRMWIQAATTMGTYQAVSGAALAATPTSAPAPLLLAPGVGEAGAAAADVMNSAAQAQAAEAGSSFNIIDFYVDFLRLLFEPIIDFLRDPIGNFAKLINDFMTNPSAALVTWFPLLFAVGYQAIFQPVGWTTWTLVATAPFLIPLIITLGVVGLNILTQNPPVPEEAAPQDQPQPASPARPDQQQPMPAATAAPAGAPSAAPAAPSTVAGGSATGAAAPATAAPAFPYVVASRDPGEGFSPTVRDSSSAKAPSSGIPAAAAGVAASAAERRRRRRRQKDEMEGRQYADAYMDYEDEPDRDGPPEPEPRVSASQRGAGPMGFTGTVTKGDADGAGLTTLAGDSFGGGPKSPMLPSTWESDPTESTPEEHHHNRKENP
ncbi:PPE family protein [Mycolicibacterium duvalii]|uniref:PPE family protein n=2 Tax=Mycolicibacterium duvalii TaxID=39688 RepID=A0A7I7K6K1_9MYCO|nr:PPE family protein [Mycolicibacterium duvalii]MCV7368999.1 PPE family protein [Mycolicibacterium duvalii]PEG44476.1 PPE family protein [Mycolicibacterium duvalii]BBX19101.1 PPE family protein [Mycolicibacterium duvalii]